METLSERRKRKSSASTLIRRPDLQFRQLGMDMALFDPATAKLYILNPTATAVWYHITPDRSIKNIAEVLALSFGYSSKNEIEEISNDVKWILTQFKRLKLLINKGDKIPKSLPGYQKMRRYIPDPEITTLKNGYIRPTFKTYTLDELKDIFESKLIGGRTVPSPFADWAGELGYSRIVLNKT